MNQNELFHYGVKRRSGRYPYGSGERPYQSEPSKRLTTEDLKKAIETGSTRAAFNEKHTIPKGTTFYRVTSNKNEKGGTGASTYVSYLPPERDLYRGGYIRFRDKAKKAYERTMKSNVDITVPSRKETMEVVNNVVKKNPALRKESVESLLNMMIERAPGIDECYDENTGKLIKNKYTNYLNNLVKANKNAPVDVSTNSIMAGLGGAPKTKAAVIEELKKRGYNGMTDYASVGGYKVKLGDREMNLSREGVDPLIVFDDSSFSNSKTKGISKGKETKSTREYNKWARSSRSYAENKDFDRLLADPSTPENVKAMIRKLYKEREW